MGKMGGEDTGSRGWNGFILPGDPDEGATSHPPGTVLVYPTPRPPGSGVAHGGIVPVAWGPLARYVEFRDSNPAVPATTTIGWELPFTPHGVPDLTEEMAERMQLDLYVRDWWEGVGSPPLVMVSQGERPDFRVRTLRGDIGLDVTRLTSGRRRHAHRLLSEIRSAIRRTRECYRGLGGAQVTVWFTANDVPGTELPPARSDHATRAAVLTHLSELDADNLSGHTQSIAGLPGGGTNVCRLGEWRPGTSFYRECGFELALAYATEHHEGDVWDEISRLAVKHDYPGIDRLVITVAAPTEPFGDSFPGDHLIWAAVPGDSIWPDPPPLAHTKVVDVHDWWLGSVTRIYPTRRTIAPARRSGPVVPTYRAGDTGEPLGWQIEPMRERSGP